MDPLRSKQTIHQSLSCFGRNLLSGIKSAIFVRVQPDSYIVSWAQLVALIILSLALRFAYDFAVVGTKGSFDASGLPGALFLIPLALVVAWRLSASAGQSKQTLLLMIAIVTLTIIVDVMGTVLQITIEKASISRLRPWALSIYYGQYIWLALAVAVTAERLLRFRRRQWPFILMVIAVILAWPLATIYRDSSLWTRPYDEDASGNPYYVLTNEDTFYLQPKLLERDLAALLPGRKGVTNLYFVGVAGYSTQDVFMKEINAADKLFSERFHARGRTITLINNPKTVTEKPIASATSVRATLKRIGAIMNPDDVLFLFLTSHGSQAHGVALDFWPLQFNDLGPVRLRQILDESGIKRRVIVVSACYSGVYVKPLEDKNTVIITAAAADRTSFGCSNEADFTYFGRAYFDEALRTTYSFTDAFALAKRHIAEREKKENITSSNPQIFVGDSIKPVLAALATKLQRDSKNINGTDALNLAIITTEKDQYKDLIDLTVMPETYVAYKQACLHQMATASPNVYVAKDANYFGGLNQSSQEWPRLMAAWTDYTETICAVYDKKTLSKIFSASLRPELNEKDLDAASTFFRTEAGKRYLKASNKTDIIDVARIRELRESVAANAYAHYKLAWDQISADFQRERTAQQKTK